MDSQGKIINGYLRLYCGIMGIEPPPKRCRVCGGELDTKYISRKCGYLCLTCYRRRNKQRAKEYYERHPDKMKAYNKMVYMNYPQKCRARAQANYLYPVRQVCEVEGCQELGQRHHPDYNRPGDIVWLCAVHDKAEHRRLLTLSECV